jgi:hypothetical protein
LKDEEKRPIQKALAQRMDIRWFLEHLQHGGFPGVGIFKLSLIGVLLHK